MHPNGPPRLVRLILLNSAPFQSRAERTLSFTAHQSTILPTAAKCPDICPLLLIASDL